MLILLVLDREVADGSLPEHDLLIFTGPIDAYFASKGLPKLEYRSIFWEKEYLEPTSKIFQPAWVGHTTHHHTTSCHSC